MKDSWKSVDHYDYFMGRWSGYVAQEFIEWLSPSPGLKWLDVGCGSGALSKVVIDNWEPAELTAIDQSEEFVTEAQKQLGSSALCKIGNALALPLKDSSVDISVSGLVLNFVPEPIKALVEKRRVTVPGGTVAVYVWDYAGMMDFLTYFWDTAVELNPKASGLHEGNRFPDTHAEALKDLFTHAGFDKIEIIPIVIKTNFRDFDDYWKPFLGNQGPAPTYVTYLNNSEKRDLREALKKRIPIQADGSIQLLARAWAAKSQV